MILNDIKMDSGYDILLISYLQFSFKLPRLANFKWTEITLIYLICDETFVDLYV